MQQNLEIQAVSEDINTDQVYDVLFAALRLEGVMYRKEEISNELFMLRKSLEGVFGHNLPDVEIR